MSKFKSVTHAVKIGDEYFKKLRLMCNDENCTQKAMIERLIQERFESPISTPTGLEPIVRYGESEEIYKVI